MSHWQQSIAHSGFCEKTALEVLIHAFVLLNQYTGIEVNWLITISNKAKANIQITTSYSKFACQ